MTAINFPSSPATGEAFQDPNSNWWLYDGTSWGRSSFLAIGQLAGVFTGLLSYNKTGG